MITLNLHILILLAQLIFLIFGDGGLVIVWLAIISAIIELYLWARRERRYKTLNWCHPVPVFVLGYCIVFYQLPFCYLAGFELSYYSRYVIFAPEKIIYCVLMAAVGLTTFFVGEQVYFLWEKERVFSKKKRIIKDINLISYLARIKLVTRVLLVASLILFIMFLQSFGSLTAFYGFAYGDTHAIVSPLSTYYQLAYTISLYLAILLQIVRLVIIKPDSIRSYFYVWDKWVLVILGITLVPFFISGDRGTYLQPLSLIVTPYFLLVKPLKFRQAIIIVVFMSFFLVLVGDIRGRINVSWKEVLQTRIEQISNPAQWPTMELANSFGTFNIATDYFPQTFPYNYGLGTCYRLIAFVPFLSGLSGIEKLNTQSNYVYSSTEFFTNILTRGAFSYGAGTSSLADVYMDFGPFGIPAVMFFWGFFMAWISMKTMRTFSAVFIFLYAYYSYFSIYVNRSSFFFGWNIFIWVLLMFYFLNRLYFRKT